MSANGLKADIAAPEIDVRFAPDIVVKPLHSLGEP
jgi:hypothetical protein